MKPIVAIQVSKESFLPFGDVIEAGQLGNNVNQGTAKRSDYLCDLVNLRDPAHFHQSDKKLFDPPAKMNVCVFRNTCILSMPFQIKLLERHKYSNQVFIPMSKSSPLPSYLVIVALNNPETDQPDLNTLSAFIFNSIQSVNYKAGCWHHPMIGLPIENGKQENLIDFVCLVHERGDHKTEEDEDTEEYHLKKDDFISVVM